MAKECESCAYKSDFKSPKCGTCMVSYYDGEQRGLPSNFKPNPQTNADRIRAMSDEELAELLGGMCKIAEQCDDCPLDGKCPGGSYDCGSWDEWLKQPAEE